MPYLCPGHDDLKPDNNEKKYVHRADHEHLNIDTIDELSTILLRDSAKWKRQMDNRFAESFVMVADTCM